MYNEWIRLLLHPEPQTKEPEPSIEVYRRPRALTRPIYNTTQSSLSKADPSQVSFPSILTFSQRTPSWLGLGQEYDIQPKSICSAVIKRIGQVEDFTLWLNILDLSWGPQLIYNNKNEGFKCFDIEDQHPPALIPRISYMLSDAIVITGESLEEAADEYLSWLYTCRDITHIVEHREVSQGHRRGYDNNSAATKPCILVIIRNVPDEKTVQKAFLEECLSSKGARDVNREGLIRLQKSLFERCKFVKWSSDVKKEITTCIKIARRLRIFRKHLWSQSTFSKLQNYLATSLARTPHRPLNIVRALGSATEIEGAALNLWPELARVSEAAKMKGNADDFLGQFLFPVIGSSVARNALRCDHGKSSMTLS